ncbi:MAG: hypothetical protein ACF8XB_18740 [Planctomycetota bacterium JB042]
MTTARRVSATLLALSGLAAATFWGPSIPVAIQSDYVDVVRTVGSVVFGVAGIWIAIAYPYAFQLASDENSDRPFGPLPHERLIRELGWSVLFSMSVVVATLLYDFVDLLARLSDWLVGHAEWVRAASFLVVVVMTATLLWAMKLTVYAVFFLPDWIEAVRLRTETARAVKYREKEPIHH